MMRTLTALILVTSVATAQNPLPGPIPAPFADAIPALADQSAWQQASTWAGPNPERVGRGAFPIGNGRVFAHLGLGERANSMRGIVGPSYATRAPATADATRDDTTIHVLAADGTRIPLSTQRVGRVRGAGFVVTEDRGEELAVRTLAFARSDGPTLVQVVDVVNTSSRRLDDHRLEIALGRAGRADGTAIVRGATVVRAVGGQPADGERLLVAIPSLAPGAPFRTTLTVQAFDDAAAPPPATIVDVDTVRATRAAWRDALADTTTYDSDHRRLRDLIEGWKVNLLTMRCAATGIVTPMADATRHGTTPVASIRHTTGALLGFLRFRMWDEAKALLEFWFDAVRVTGRLTENVPLVLDRSAADATDVDWKSVVVPGSELPSWVILQHFWYWRATRDTQLIEAHWPLLDVCFKRQRRGEDTLMTFSGSEPWLAGELQALDAESLPRATQFVGHDPVHGRDAYSFTSGVLFLIAVQAIGELVNGLDRMRNPAKYADAELPPQQRPGHRYTQRTYDLMTDIEGRYWLDDVGHFAPAVSPLTGAPHVAPVAAANLMPLWVGWTFPTGERSRDNLRNALAALRRDGARVGSTSTTDAVGGAVQGMLVTALSERDAKERLDAVDTLLAMAEPAGEWSSLYDGDGRPIGQPLDPRTCGINLDALAFAITGIRHVSVPNWDANDIRLEFRLPHGATWLQVERTAKDDRVLDLWVREEFAPMTDAEKTANAEQPADKQRDPTVAHRRMHFVVELVEGTPPKGYYDVALNASGTVFVRYLWDDVPSVREDRQITPRRVEDREYWTEDDETFLAGRQEPVTGAANAADDDAQVLVLSTRADAATLYDGGANARVELFDTALPFAFSTLRSRLLRESGEPRVRAVFLDWGFDAGPPTSWTPKAFWASARWRGLLEEFESGGGRIERPRYVETATWVDGDGNERTLAAAADGSLRLPDGDGALRFALPQFRGDAILRVGGDVARVATADGETRLARAPSPVRTPDLAAALLGSTLSGEALVVEPQAGKSRRVWLRLTDASGRRAPAAGTK